MSEISVPDDIYEILLKLTELYEEYDLQEIVEATLMNGLNSFFGDEGFKCYLTSKPELNLAISEAIAKACLRLSKEGKIDVDKKDRLNIEGMSQISERISKMRRKDPFWRIPPP